MIRIPPCHLSFHPRALSVPLSPMPRPFSDPKKRPLQSRARISHNFMAPGVSQKTQRTRLPSSAIPLKLNSQKPPRPHKPKLDISSCIARNTMRLGKSAFGVAASQACCANQELRCSTFGGLMACGLTHWAVTPLDLVKCRRQIDGKLYKGNVDGWSKIMKAEGVRGLYTGGSPTFFGYSVQGALKYGFYEFFKKVGQTLKAVHATSLATADIFCYSSIPTRSARRTL